MSLNLTCSAHFLNKTLPFFFRTDLADPLFQSKLPFMRVAKKAIDILHHAVHLLNFTTFDNTKIVMHNAQSLGIPCSDASSSSFDSSCTIICLSSKKLCLRLAKLCLHVLIELTTQILTQSVC